MFGKTERYTFNNGVVDFGSDPNSLMKLTANVFDFEKTNFKIFFSFYEGFYIKDYAKNIRTAFKVEQTPYLLD